MNIQILIDSTTKMPTVWVCGICKTMYTSAHKKGYEKAEKCCQPKTTPQPKCNTCGNEFIKHPTHTTKAQCFQEGIIFFDTYLHKGALLIIEGEETEVKHLMSVKARHAYKSSTLLVPGVNEYRDSESNITALLNFISFCENTTEKSMRNTIKEGIVKLPENHQQLFKRMYAYPKHKKNLPDVDSDILLVIDSMDSTKLNQAMKQIQKTLYKINSEN